MLVSIAIHPTVREQLRLWARELDAMADELEGRGVEHSGGATGDAIRDLIARWQAELERTRDPITRQHIERQIAPLRQELRQGEPAWIVKQG